MAEEIHDPVAAVLDSLNAGIFVGRRKEIERLQSFVNDLESGIGRFVLVCGEEGIGKTKLLEKLEIYAEGKKVDVFFGHCRDELRAPYLPIIEVLRGIAKRRGDESAAIFGEHAGELLKLVPGLVPGLEAGPPGSPTRSEEQGKLEMHEAITDTFINVAKSRPAIIVLEDLHWADDYSTALLTFLARNIPTGDSGLMIIGSYRPREADESAPLSQALGDLLLRDKLAERIPISGFRENEVENFLQKLGVTRSVNSTSMDLVKQTDGNPRFLEEVIRYLAETRRLERRGGTWTISQPAGEHEIPGILKNVIARHLSGLTPECRRVMVIAAFIGGRFRYEILKAVADMPESELFERLGEAHRSRVVYESKDEHEDEKGKGVYAFSNALTAQHLRDDFVSQHGEKLHYDIGTAIKRISPEGLGPHVMELAHHFSKAGASVDNGELAQYHELAGEYAMNTYVYGEASKHYNSAILLLDSLEDEEQREANQPKVAEFHMEAGRALYKNRDIGPALENYESAKAIHKKLEDRENDFEASIRMAQCEVTRSPPGQFAGHRHLQDALELTEGGGSERMSRYLSQAANNHFWALNLPDSKELANEGADLAQRLGNHDDLLKANMVSGVSNFFTLDPNQSLNSLAELDAPSAGDEVDDWYSASLAVRRPLPLLCLGKIAEARSAAEAGKSDALRVRHWPDATLAAGALATYHLIRGHRSAVATHCEDGITATHRSDYHWGELLFLPAMACANYLEGRYEDAKAELAQLLPGGDFFQGDNGIGVELASVWQTLIKVREGNRDIHPDLIDDSGVPLLEAMKCAAWAEIALLRGDSSLALAQLPALRRIYKKKVVFLPGWAVLVPRLLGEIESQCGLLDNAEQSLRLAMKSAEDASAGPETGRSAMALEKLLTSRGKTQDLVEAVELRVRAADMFAKHGMIPFSADLESLRGLEPELEGPSHASYPNGLTSREMEVLVLISAGSTNQEIAKELTITKHTVIRHVSNIYNKTDCRNRAEAVGYAHRNDIGGG